MKSLKYSLKSKLSVRSLSGLCCRCSLRSEPFTFVRFGESRWTITLGNSSSFYTRSCEPIQKRPDSHKIKFNSIFINQLKEQTNCFTNIAKLRTMKHHYYLLIVLAIFIFSSCKQNEGRPEENSQTLTISTQEEDQERLDERLALTERRWDSLEGILKDKDLEITYRDSIKKFILENRYEQEEIYKEFIRENPSSVISVSNLNGFKFTWGKEQTQELYNSLNSEMQESETGQKIATYLKYYNSPEVGDMFTDFELPNLNGEKIRIAENMGKYTLLEFWASWCKGCREEHPELIKVYEKNKEKGFKVIGISGDNLEEDWMKAVEKDKLPWLNLRDPDGRESIVQYQYGILYLPNNFLIDQVGKIIAKDVKPEELEKILQGS